MPSIFPSTKFFQSTSNKRLKPVMTTGLVNMHIDQSIANLGPHRMFNGPSELYCIPIRIKGVGVVDADPNTLYEPHHEKICLCCMLTTKA